MKGESSGAVCTPMASASSNISDYISFSILISLTLLFRFLLNLFFTFLQLLFSVFLFRGNNIPLSLVLLLESSLHSFSFPSALIFLVSPIFFHLLSLFSPFRFCPSKVELSTFPTFSSLFIQLQKYGYYFSNFFLLKLLPKKKKKARAFTFFTYFRLKDIVIQLQC